MDATETLQRLCYGGESLEAVVPAGPGAVGVTSHRVLALTPNGPGRRFRTVDRPNVRDIEAGTSGPTSHRDRSVTAGLGAVALLVSGTLVDLGGLVQPVEAPTGMGLEALFAMIEGLVAALALVDEALILLGLLALLVALGSLAWYLRERNRVIEIHVAGGDSVRVPVGRGGAVEVDRLRGALERAATGPIDSESPDP